MIQPPPLALYVHMPWCVRKCPYCDFNSHAIAPEKLPAQRYIDALLADLEAALPCAQARPVRSIFMGGGTPSLLSPQAIARLLEALRARLSLAPDCEITLEANPGSFERERFAAYAQAGVTRLSLGVQSFNDAHLRALGRIHSAAQALAAAAEAARHFERFNFDLMYALPAQKLCDLERDMAQALAFAPPHLSLYHLSIEANTRFASQPPQQLPDEDSASDMLDAIAACCAQAHLQRYEVSAWARAGYECAHNRNYWQFGDYLGLGAGAHSKITTAQGSVERYIRWSNPQRYMQQALRGKAIAQQHTVAEADLAFEYMLGALRLREGFALADFGARTGLPISAIAPHIHTACQRGWLQRSSTHIRPTARGFDFLSDVQALFLP